MTRRKARRRARRVRVYSKASMLRCTGPGCRKIQAYSEAEAWAVARSYYEDRGGEEPQRVYPCKQTPGVWHWTRQETYDGD